MKKALAGIVCLLVSAVLLAQTNTSPVSAAPVSWGQTLVSRIRGTPVTEYWFFSSPTQGRSYCVESGNVQSGALANSSADTVIELYNDSGLFARNDDALDVPRNGPLSRACWVHSGADPFVYTKLTPNTVAVSDTNVTLRWVETTLFCPWFFVAGDYNAFSLIHNTGDSELSGVVVTWRSLTGAIAGQTTFSIPGHGTTIVNARNFVDPLVFSSGSIEIAHPSSPEAVVGSTTTLSATTGLGFDADFEQRKPW